MAPFSWPELTGRVRPDYDGMTYQERETLKADAWRRFREAPTPLAKADAIEEVIHAHFDRSRESFRGRHPVFAVYARHWVAANASRPQLALGIAVGALLQARYPRPRVRHIADGRTYWQHAAIRA